MGAKRLLAVWAHPDDEAFGPVGTMCLARDNGWETALITATRGEGGQLGQVELAPGQTIGDLREAELHCASQVIGIDQLYIWRYPDGALKEIPIQTLVNDILAVMRDFRPQVVLSFGPDGITGHGDHIAVGSATEQAFERLRAEVGTEVAPQRLYYVTTRPDYTGPRRMGEAAPPKPPTTVLNVSAYEQVKLEALQCHASQRSNWEPLLNDRDWLTTNRFFRAFPPFEDNQPIETTIFDV
jgi:LmbE family N-acetylglucosaminyl deacetylase